MTKLAIDANSKGIQCLRPAATQKVAISGTAASAAAWGSGVRVLRLVSTTDLFYSVVGTATTSSVYLPAGTIEFIHVFSTDGLSAITSGAVGDLFVTEMV